MEKQPSIGLIEILLKAINSDLKHFKLFSFIVLLPTIIVFVCVMWVIKPMYAATAVVTPPASSSPSLNGLSSMLGGAAGMSSLLGLSTSDDDANAVWTIFNSWELHNQVIEEFNLAEHYEFDGNFHADLLKMFRKKFGVEMNKEDMFAVSMEDEDYKLAAKMVRFMLEKADSAFNAFKTAQAKQSREYFQSRLDSCEHVLDSLLENFVKFQKENNFYDPEIQLESTLKYMSSLQAKREEVAMEMAFEKADRGTDSRRYDELSKRYDGVNAALNGALNGKNSNVGMVALKKSPQLGLEYMRRENEIRVQEAMYKLLRQQSEQLKLEEAKMLTNLHILEPPWENDKKIYPLRGVTLVFTFAVAVLIGSILCSLLTYFEEEEKKGSDVAREWIAFKGFFSRKSKG
ncbi:MAG: lipopolysaccharide biosynthesis protein [Fibrobacter sp.]|nr:lipopolysaccharide biosynthesis protein [Fibrobacter sp.]